MNKLILVLLLLLTLVLSIGLMACYDDPIVANAEEEVVEQVDSNYRNASITFTNAPVHIYVPHGLTVDGVIGYDNVFKSNYLYSRQSTATTDFMTMLYEFIDSNGNSYGKEILQVGKINYQYLAPSMQYTATFRNVAATSNNLNELTSFSSKRAYEHLDARIVVPNGIEWVNTVSRSFTIDVSFPDNYSINLYQCKVRACSLVDYNCYPYNDDIWVEYSIVNNTSYAPFELYYSSMEGSNSVEPLYSIGVDYDSVYDNGYNVGYDTGYNAGQQAGASSGYDSGYSEGVQAGTTVGYNQGFNAGVMQSNDYSFLSLMTSVVDAPISVFSSMFDFEVLGFNMSTFLFSILTICLILALVKFLI